VGIPTTVVYARELSQPAILEGIKAGHVYIKVNGPDGPDLYLTSGTAMMGDEITATPGRDVTFTLSAKNAGDAKPVISLDGKPQSTSTTTFTWTSDGRRHWVRAELDSPSGDPVTITNPIYINWK